MFLHFSSFFLPPVGSALKGAEKASIRYSYGTTTIKAEWKRMAKNKGKEQNELSRFVCFELKVTY
jgi:hypothetical protein